MNLCTSKVSSKENVYRIKMKTIKRHLEDQNTKVQLELIDDHGRSETIVLDETDTFTIETMKDLGKVCLPISLTLASILIS